MKAVIAIPCGPVRKAGAKQLEFKSTADASRYFGIDRTYICSLIRKARQRNNPYCGFFFDYKIEEDDV